jgi:cell division protein FtsL
MQLKGRHWIVLWLIAFSAVAAVVIERQTRAYIVADSLSTIRERRSALDARAAALQRSIEEASSRSAIGRKAEALGLRAPTGTEYILFPMPPAPGRR